MATKSKPTAAIRGQAAGGAMDGYVTSSIVHPNRPNSQASNYLPLAMQQEALRYATNYGWQVLPVRGKVPATPNGHLDASSDVETIAELFAAAGKVTGVGARMGGALRLVGLEIDHKHGATVDTFYKLTGVRMGDYKTPTMRTGNGWRMICYVPTAQDCDYGDLELDGKGIALKGNGGQVVLPPSKHPSGKRYAWVPGLEPWTVDVAPVPALVLDKIRAKQALTAQNGPTAAQSSQHGQYDLQDLKAMLSALKPWQDGYTWWVKMLMAAHDGFGDDALPLVEAWADGKPGEVAKKFATFKENGNHTGKVTIGTLVYHARAAGWKPTPKDDDGETLPEHWRITPEDWQACPTCANLYTEPFDDGSVRTFHRWCRRPACPVFKKKLMRDALRVVFSWRGVASEIVPAADWRKRRKTVSLACGDNWRRLPMADGGVLLLYETDKPTEQLDDVLETAAFVVLDNAEARRAKRAEKRQALAEALAGARLDPQLAPLEVLLSKKRPNYAAARAFLDSIDVHAVLDVATLELVRAALDVLASKTPGNVSPPRQKRTAQAPALAELAAQPPRAKSLGPVLVSKPYHRRAILDVLNRLQIPWERRPYGGWQTAPLDDAQRLQLITALAFAVHGAIVPAGVLNSAMVPHGKEHDAQPGGKVYLNPHQALIDAHKRGRKVPRLERQALE